ncbi:MAG: ABC transporter permease [Pyrinomonadaceae bacterium]
MEPDEARREAEQGIGRLESVKEQGREVRGSRWLESFWRDCRYGARSLRNSPGFTLAAVLTLAVSIGANTAIFGLVNAVLLRPLPYPDADQLVKLYGRDAAGENFSVAPADFLDHYRQARSFEGLAAYRETPFNLTGRERPERVNGAVVSPEFFALLKVQPRAGRIILPGLDEPGGPRVIVLSDALWQKWYGRDPDVVGKTLNLDGEPRTVIGVMPEGFQFPAGSELWASSRYAVPEHPLRPTSDPSLRRDTHYFDVVGRLKPDVTPEQATAEAGAIAARIKQQYGDGEEAVGASVVSLHEDIVGGTRPALLLLVGAVAILLLIACANVANILLARGASRHKEIVLRMALGASRVRLVRQLLIESLLLASAGGLIGALLAVWGITPLKALMPPDMSTGAGPSLDGRVFVFAAAVSLSSVLIVGLFPAMNLAGLDLNGVLKEGGRGGAGGARSAKARRMLVASEIALAVVLLVGAGLLMRSFYRLSEVSLGFDPREVVSAQLTLPQTRYPEKIDRARFVRQVLERLGSEPGLASTAVISRLPLNPGASTRSVEVQGRMSPPSGEVTPDYLVISPHYFRSLSIPLLAGRDFDERDDAGGPRVVIINEAVARHFWTGQDPLGKLIKIDDDWSQVVGVVGNVRQRSPAQEPPPSVYVPYAQDPWPFMSLVVRTKSDTAVAARALETAVGSADKDVPVYKVRAMSEVVAQSLSARRWRMLLLGLFGLTALTLACLGIYGVTAYSVVQRTREIGIRLALGAQKRDVLRLVIAQGLKLALVGVAVGLLAALALMKLAASLLYGIDVADPLTLAGVSALLIVLTILACLVPARRATKVNPIIALKHE